MIFLNSTYVATLTFKSFRLIIAFMIYYDLECKQFNIINAFLNVKLKEHIKVYYKLPNSFKKLDVYIKLNRTLYELKESLTL